MFTLCGFTVRSQECTLRGQEEQGVTSTAGCVHSIIDSISELIKAACIIVPLLTACPFSLETQLIFFLTH